MRKPPNQLSATSMGKQKKWQTCFKAVTSAGFTIIVLATQKGEAERSLLSWELEAILDYVARPRPAQYLKQKNLNPTTAQWKSPYLTSCSTSGPKAQDKKLLTPF